MFSIDGIAHVFIKSFKLVRDFFYPKSCVICDSPIDDLKDICILCRQILPYKQANICVQCAQPLIGISEVCCGRCQNKPPPFSKTFCLFDYQPPLVSLIKQLKFQQKLYIATLLSQLFQEKIFAAYTPDSLPNLIIPVPLHPERLKERGFNQALVLAKPIAKALKIPFDYVSLQRHKNTTAQSELTASLREKNVSDAFSSCRDYSNLRVAVLDDVMTTSFTMSACCRVIIEKGAKEVHAWCIARR